MKYYEPEKVNETPELDSFVMKKFDIDIKKE